MFALPGPVQAYADLHTDDQAAALAAFQELLNAAGRAERMVYDAVDVLRRNGLTWQQIADQLLITRQAAQQRYGR